VKGYLRVSLIWHKIYANRRKRTEEVQSLSNVQMKQKKELVENNNFDDFQKSLRNKHSKGF
jgi:CRISPR/Cas system CSM-associated protein Csm5 (group 7 of RAMP superfamily)